ncbi:MAG TPA: stage II sporulation protein R [Firmicutes bacterium]|nr:stage II sporulation protein R [Candidatus Fermentithermobacillaceae bacterium]
MRSALGQALLLSVVAGLILFMGWSYSQANRAEKAYTDNNLMKLRNDDAIPTHKGTSLTSPGEWPSLTPDSTIRLHIPANSDEPGDQKVKEEIRDAVIERFGADLNGVEDAHEAEDLLRSRLPEIEALANEHLRASGVSYSAKAELKTVHFPEKTYRLAGGEVVRLPQGDYKALQLTLGTGKGANWWCVMYPPLCYFDLVQRGVVPGTWTDVSVPADGSEMGGPVKGVVFIDEELTEDVKVEIRSLILDAVRYGIIRIGKALSVLAGAGPAQAGVSNMD